MSTFTRAVDPGDDYDPTYLYDDSLRYEAQYAAGAATTMMGFGADTSGGCGCGNPCGDCGNCGPYGDASCDCMCFNGLDSAMMMGYDGLGIYEAEPVGPPEFFTDPYGVEAFDQPDLSLHVTTLDGFGAPPAKLPKAKDCSKLLGTRQKKECEEANRMAAAVTVEVDKPREGRSWLSRNKWWVIGGAAAVIVVGGGAWWLLRKRRA